MDRSSLIYIGTEHGRSRAEEPFGTRIRALLAISLASKRALVYIISGSVLAVGLGQRGKPMAI